MDKMQELKGPPALEHLAGIYQQLYIAPGPEGPEKYADVVMRGQEIRDGNLSHFSRDERDRLEYEDTPEGKVPIITLHKRADFITFMRIMANRCRTVDIPDIQGASIISGVINWARIRSHKKSFFADEKRKGNPDPDWDAEFSRFTADKANFKDTLIVITSGPYSGVETGRINKYLEGSDLREAPLSEKEWLSLSDTIRRYHECTHYICRKRYPEKKDAVLDELTADAVGIYAAFGKYDPELEKLFLGIEGEKYAGGRLENYVEEAENGDRQETLDRLSLKISGILEGFDEILSGREIPPYEAACILEESMEV